MSVGRKYFRTVLSHIGPPKMMILGFGSVILVGALLLMLPISSADGHTTGFINSLFTSTSSVCVTGLTVLDTSIHWSTFGKVVIITLIQIGGLGFMSISALVALILGKKINLRQRLLIKEQLNQTQLAGAVLLIKNVFKLTFIIESTGALLLSTVFIPKFGVAKGIAYSIFHSISAFCNAGFDLMGRTSGAFSSLVDYGNNPIVVFTITTLIILGGLGFGVIVCLKTNKLTFRKYTLTTKLVCITTIILIITGTTLIFAGEYANPHSMGNMSLWDKFQIAYFQSVTTRTAGFATMDLSTFRGSTLLVMIVLMFIGASPSSTGGGIKTTTLAVLFIIIRAFFKNDKEVTVFKRRLSNFTTRKACGVLVISLSLLAISIYLLMLTQNDKFTLINATFEAVSAFATVGLTITGSADLNAVGKLIIIFLMFAGRVGSITIFSLLVHDTKPKNIRYPEGKVMVG